MSEREPRPAGDRAIYFIAFTLFIDTMGFGVVMPVLPRLLVELTGEPMAQTARTAGFLLVVFAVMQFLFSPVIGNLSDRFGRRPVLLISMAAFGLNYLLMGFAPSVLWLFVGRAFAGIAGAIHSPANAYIADVTPPDQRAARFAMVSAVIGIGFALGPAIGGVLGQFGVRAPFFAAAALAAVNVLFGLFVLPESLPAERRRAFSLRRSNPIGAVGALARRRDVLVVSAAVFLMMLAYAVYPSVWAFFTILKFGWSEGQVGISLGYMGALMSIVQLTLTARAVRRLGENGVGVLGLTSGMIGMVLCALAVQPWMLYAACTVAALQSMAGAAISALLSRRTPPDEQGEMQGAIGSLNALASILGPLAMTQTLTAFTAPGAPVQYAGAPFVLAGILLLAALALFTFAALRPRRDESRRFP